MLDKGLFIRYISINSCIILMRGCGEMVDTHALGACAVRHEGSSPFIPTKLKMRSVKT